MTPDAGRNERSRGGGPGSDELLQLVLADLEELQAGDVEILDVRELTDVTDFMVVATGRTNRHVRAITDLVVVSAKHRDAPPIGVEGEREGDWVLVDLGDVVVHVMRPEARELYQLEKLWSPIVALREKTGAPVP